MDELVSLKAKATDGTPLEAVFAPKRGMNLLSYKKGDIEVIDPSTRTLYDERSAGLGSLIGPHFHRRRYNAISYIPSEEAFPHIKRVLEKSGEIDPFSHGISRYAPWNFQAAADEIKGVLKGSDSWNGVSLKEIEGQNFTMNFEAKLSAQGLNIKLSVVSDTDSLVGLHYYYHLPENNGFVTSKVKSYFLDASGARVPLDEKPWFNKTTHELRFPANQGVDMAFHSYPDPLNTEILLDALKWKLTIKTHSLNEENSWQLYRPEKGSFICIEPISAQDPRHPNLTVSSMDVLLTIQ